jgi:hypothetical protein
MSGQYPDGLESDLGLGPRCDQTNALDDHFPVRTAFRHQKAERVDRRSCGAHGPVHLVVDGLRRGSQTSAAHGRFPQRPDGSSQKCWGEHLDSHLHGGFVVVDRSHHENLSHGKPGHVADGALPKRHLDVQASLEDGVRAQAVVPYLVVLHQGVVPLVDDVVPQYLQQP